MPSVSIWPVPQGTLSNAGRLVVLRAPEGSPPGQPGWQDGPAGNKVGEDEIVAEIVTDQELRGVVFGDPVMHMMRVYRRRVEVLATRAVTGAGVWS